MRALIGVLALLVILDPVLFDRSIVHLLVWHSVIFLILLLALLMVESAQDASFDERAQPRAPRFVPALGFKALTPLYDGVVKATTREGLFKQTLIAQANIQPGQHVLDLRAAPARWRFRWHSFSRSPRSREWMAILRYWRGLAKRSSVQVCGCGLITPTQPPCPTGLGSSTA
jgi:hypothetical protein